MIPDTPKATPIEPAKKPYVPPRLEVFGDLSAVTQNTSTGGTMGDGAKAGATKT